MADPFAAYPAAPAGTPGISPPPATLPDDPFAAYPLAPQQRPQEPRSASGVVESLQAGFQASAPGLAWRGRLPDLVINPEHSAWWERALSGVAQIGMELPLMVGGATVGAPAGAAVGTAVAPGVGTAVGSLLGAGAGMGAIPAAIRQTLIEAYKSGDVMTAADFWNSVREVAKTTATEAGINAAAMGAGAVAGRVVGKAIAPSIGQSISVPTAIRSIEAADIATQIAAMPTIPAILQGRLPDAQEFVDAAILIGGLKAAHVASSNIVSVFVKTGKTPAEQVADVQEGRVDPQEFVGPPEKPVDPEVLKGLLKARLDAINMKLEGTPDKTVTGPDGKPITIPGQPKQFVSPEERAERDWLAANIDNADALAKRYSLKRPQQAEEEYVPPSRAEMLKVQENLFTETARLDEMAAKAEASPLSDPERLEMNALKARVLDLENQLRAGAPELSRTPTYTADQFVEARKQADTRLAELTTKAETEALTDTERAERVFLSNSLDRPTALAKHFGFEPILTERPTPQAIDASAQRIHDDVLRQLKDADEARKAAGLDPLGDDHAEAVAALVRARVRTRAERLGVLPESLYAERPVKIADETAALDAATKIEQPAPAPELGPPVEVDLFGDPIQTPTDAPAERMQIADLATQEVPLANLVLSKEVPQFKNAANREGVVVPLGGAFDRTGVGPIQVWERLDGTLEVISGRHRLDLARRSGEETIPAQIHREADGFTAKQAATLDAQLNIREEQGSVADYAQYFKDAEIGKDAADKLGLLARAKGRAGFSIARDASPDLLASHRAGRLTDEAALSISAAAPGSARLQALGIAAVQDGKSILYATNLMRSVDLMAAERMAAGQQGDIFGFDDSALREASSMAKKAASKQRAISEQIAAVSGASKRPELARKMGVNVEDPAAVQAKIIELKNEQYLWDNWPLYPELVAKLRDPSLKQDDIPMLPETPAEAAARDRDAAQAAMRKIEETRKTTESLAKFWSARTWKTEAEARAMMRDRIIRDNEHYPMFTATDPAVVDQIQFVRAKGGQVKTKIPATPKKQVAWSEKRPDRGEGSSPEVDWYGRDNQDKGTPESIREEFARGDVKIYRAWIPVDELPTARGDDIKNGVLTPESGARDELSFRGDPPPLKISVGKGGKVQIEDGNHRLAWWREQGHDYVPAWVLDGRPESKLPNNVLYQGSARDTWYRSALGEAVNAANIKAAPAKGWQDFFKGQVAKGGIKADEIKWSGIEEWLQLQEGRVTKEQVADYLANNGVKVEEVMLGERPNTLPDDWAVQEKTAELEALGWMAPWIVTEKNGTVVGQGSSREAAIADALQSRSADLEATPTKYGTYQLPGGENYRELLLTLPRKPFDYQAATKETNRIAGEYEDRINAVIDQANSGEYPGGRTAGFQEADRLRDERERVLAPIRAEAPKQPNFQSSHFDQPNILAHIRFNERTDADGKKVLFIEEFQSDWAQKGKKEGFALTPERKAELYTRRSEIEAIGKAATPEQKQEWADIMNELQPNRERTTPSAPFVGKTDAWVGLTLKRMIAYAAENGFDRVAWTRGEQQVERYTSALRKAVDVIEWKKTDKGVQLVGYKNNGRPTGRPMDDGAGGIVQPTDRNQLVNRSKVVDTTEKEDALSDAIGKAMAEKIISDPNQSGTIEGENIRIDSTGMAGFYDRIVPKVANEVLKKLGGGKVADVSFERKQKEWEVFDPRDGRAIESFDTERQAQIWVEEHPGTDYARHTDGWNVADTSNELSPTRQQGFDITQSMKDKATEGLPLFQQRDQMHRGSYDIAENLITTLQGADKSTVVHELTHSWLEEMKADAARPDAPASIKADWEIIRRELAIPENGEISRASHEQFARTGERYLAEGEAPSRELQGVFARFREWLLDIYKSVMNLNVEINPELRQVLDRMLATDEEIRLAREMNIPRAYVPEATAIKAAEIVPPPAARRKIEPGFKAEQASMQPFADEIPPGPGEAPDNIHVNYAYINSPDDVKLAMQRMAEIDQTNIQTQRGGTEGVKSWAEANAEQARYLNDILGGNEDTLHLFEPRDPNAPQVDARLGILKKLAVGAAKDSARLRDVVLDAGHDATVRQQLEYMGSIERARMIQAEFLGERAAVARALNALKDTTEGTGEIARMLEVIGLGETDGTLFQAARTPAEEQAYLKAKLDEILQNYRGKTVLDIAKLHKEIGTLKGSFKFTEEVSKATKWDMVVEGWKSGLLSGPVTHTTNLFGTGAFMAMRAPVDALSAIIGMARGASPGIGESDRASMSEAVARITGMMGGVQDGLKLAAATFRLDDPTGKTEAYRTAIPGRAGEIIRIPLRLMGAEDALVSSMYQRGELRTLAIRQAFDENMNPGTREFADRVQQLVDSPTEDMKVAAETAATRMTFNAPLGEKGVALQLFVAKWNLQWMIPFIRTPINIAKEMARMSPFAPIVGEWRADIAKGGVARDRALAEIALGTSVMGITMAYAFAGNISGSTGPDPGKNRGKAGVWQPNSILIGDTWYEYGRIQPTGTLMVLAADIAAVWDHMTEEEKDKIPKMLAIAFSNAVTNQTFLQGITNFVNAMGDPTRFAPKFLQGLAGSVVPNIIAQPTAMADPVVREVNSMLDAVQARLPGFRQNLLPSRDWLGEPRPARERLGVILPSRTLEVSDDKVRLEAARLDISMAAPPRKTHIGKGTGKLGDVELTPEEIDTFEKVGGQFAHQILTNVVNAPDYDKIPDMVKRRIYSNVLTASHRIAAVAALPMEKRMQYLQTITEKVAQELTAGDQ